VCLVVAVHFLQLFDLLFHAVNLLHHQEHCSHERGVVIDFFRLVAEGFVTESLVAWGMGRRWCWCTILRLWSGGGNWQCFRLSRVLVGWRWGIPFGLFGVGEILRLFVFGEVILEFCITDVLVVVVLFACNHEFLR
jgi:hypothetical protein